MNSASSSPRAAVAVVSVSVVVGLAIGGALWLGSQNLLMGATIGLILAALFGGFAVFSLRAGSAPGGRPGVPRRGAGADGGASVVGGSGAAGCGDGGGGDGGGGGGGDGGC